MDPIQNEQSTKRPLTQGDVFPLYSLWKSRSTNRVYILLGYWHIYETDGTSYKKETRLLDVRREREITLQYKEFSHDIERGELVRIIQKEQ
jgi:hypothetical protein